MKNTYFTMIELLVVISIIAILTTILLPSLSKARGRVKALHCMNNQKQLHTYTMTYIESFDGYVVPLIGAYGRLGGDSAGLKAWPSAIATVNNFELNERGIFSRFWADHDQSVLFCSAHDGTNQNNRFDRISYGMLFRGVAAYKNNDTPRISMKINKVGKASNTLYLADSTRSSYLTVFNGNHLGGDNICFVDGHVENNKKTTWLNSHFFDPNYAVSTTESPFRYGD